MSQQNFIKKSIKLMNAVSDPGEVYVSEYILRKSYVGNKDFQQSIVSMAKELGISAKWLKDILKSLIGKNIIIKTNGPSMQHACSYRMNPEYLVNVK